MNNELLKTALAYKAAGLDVIPDHPTQKYPVGFTNWETKEFTEPELREYILNHGYSIGLRNQEGLDFDNHYTGEAEEYFNAWRALVNDLLPGIIDKLLIEMTPHEGYHVSWKCSEIEGNQKLAQRKPTPEELEKNPNCKAITSIETRGLGGQFVVAPTEGYVVINGDWLNLPTITPEDRKILIDCAKSLNKIVEEKVEYKTLSFRSDNLGDRPGDKFNQEGAQEALDLLIANGWNILFNRGNSIYLRRPGKDSGISASFGHVAPGVFYNFSSNASPFESEKAYPPFSVYAILKHNGDFTEAARELGKRNISQVVQPNGPVASEKTSIADFLDDLETPQNKMSSGIKLIDQEIDFEGGNAYIIGGCPKSGKSALCMNVASNHLALGNKVSYVNTEFTKREFITRMAGIYFRVPYAKVTSEQIREYVDKFKSSLLYSGIGQDEIDANVLLKKVTDEVKDGVKVIFFDNVTTFANGAALGVEDYKPQVYVMNELVRLAKQNGIIIFVVVHTKEPPLERALTSRIKDILESRDPSRIFKESVTIMAKPTSEDLYGGKRMISQFSGIILIWRPFLKHNDQYFNKTAQIILESFRNHQAGVAIEAVFKGEYATFEMLWKTNNSSDFLEADTYQPTPKKISEIYQSFDEDGERITKKL